MFPSCQLGGWVHTRVLPPCSLYYPAQPTDPLMPHDARSFAGLERGFHLREFTAESSPDGSLVRAGALPVFKGPEVWAALPTWVWEDGENPATLLLFTPPSKLFKCTGQRCEAYSHCCATTATTHFQNSLHLATETSVFLISSFPPHPDKHHSTLYYL